MIPFRNVAVFLVVVICTAASTQQPPDAQKFYEPIINDLKTQQDTGGKNIFMDKRIFQWWDPDKRLSEQPWIFIESHESQLIDRFLRLEIIQGVCYPTRRADRPSERLRVLGDNTSLAVSFSLPRRVEDEQNEFQVTIIVHTSNQYASGRTLGFTAQYLYTFERESGKWVITKKETLRRS